MVLLLVLEHLQRVVGTGTFFRVAALLRRDAVVRLVKPPVDDDVVGRGAMFFLLLQHRAHEVLAKRLQPLWELGRFALDVLLVLEREPAIQKAVHDDAQCPDIHLEAIILGEDLGRPEDPGAHLGAQAPPTLQALGGTKVTEGNSAERVPQVLSGEQEVIPLDIPVHDALAVEVLDGCHHLVADVDDVPGIDLATLLHVGLHAIHQVSSRILVHDNAHEAPFKIHGVEADDVLMAKRLHNLRLPPDDCGRGFHLVHHLHCDLHATLAVLASIDHTKGPFPQSVSHGVLLQQSFATGHFLLYTDI
mmetsp:Transcript_62759/g.149887  ORF Transcript_62759/g.149887 Transcript_62759/m.149887 type:complete len:304 (+) Transcript_62759:619-1530(+)